MRYRIVIPKRIQKKLDNIERIYRDRITAALAGLEEEPYRGKKLSGNRKREWSYRVWPFRIVYQINSRELVILIINIGNRRDVYQ